MSRPLAMLVVAAMLAAPAWAEVAAPGTPGPVDGTTQTDDVSFKDDAYLRMTVPVRLSGEGPFRFMVDTGADRTAISRQLAERLNLVGGARASLHGVAGVSAVETAMVPELQLSRKSVKVADAPLLDRDHMGADGILGVDSLRSQRVLFDFEQNLMSIVPSATPIDRFDPNEIVITASRRNGRLIFSEATVNGRAVTVILDTGSQVSIGNQALRDMLAKRNRGDPIDDIEIQSVTGQALAGHYAYLRELDMGGVTLKDLAVVFADAHTFRKLDLEKKPALLLGMNAIRAFKRVSIDFASRKFRVVVPQGSALEVELAAPASLTRSTRGR